MKRRDALRTLLLAAGAGIAPVGWKAGPNTRDHRTETVRLARSLPRGRAHVVAADPNMSPDAVLTPLVSALQDGGRSVQTARSGVVPGRIDDVLVVREPDIPIRQLWIELHELDRNARHRNLTVIVGWQMETEAGAVWITRFRDVAGWVIRVHDAEFDVPPEVVPSHYRTPVAVFDGGDRIASFALVEAVTDPF